MLPQLKTSEENCRIFFKNFRIKQGVCCKKCKSQQHYWLQGKWQWQCALCSFRTTLTSGTVLENTKLPIRTWFICMQHMFSKPEGISAREVQFKIGAKRYEPIWAMMHKIRKRMGVSEELEGLSQSVEIHLGRILTYLPTENRIHRPFISLIALRDKSKSIVRLNMVNYLELSRASPKLVSPRPNIAQFEIKLDFDRQVVKNPKLEFIFEKLRTKVFKIHHGVQCDYLNNYVSEQSYLLNNLSKGVFFKTLV